MSLSRDLLTRGRLNISPAVVPSAQPRSSIDPGSATSNAPSELSKQTVPGHAVQRSDSFTSVWDGVTFDPAGNPIMDLVFDGPGSGYKWRVERASVGSTATNWTKVEVHAGQINNANPFPTLVDNASVPATDIADEASPIYVGPNQALTFRFVGSGGTSTGDDGTARIQWVEEKL